MALQARGCLTRGEKLVNTYITQRGIVEEEELKETVKQLALFWPERIRNVDVKTVIGRINSKIQAYHMSIMDYTDHITDTNYYVFSWNLHKNDLILTKCCQLSKKQVRFAKGIIDLCLNNRGLTARSTINKYNQCISNIPSYDEMELSRPELNEMILYMLDNKYIVELSDDIIDECKEIAENVIENNNNNNNNNSNSSNSSNSDSDSDNMDERFDEMKYGECYRLGPTAISTLGNKNYIDLRTEAMYEDADSSPMCLLTCMMCQDYIYCGIGLKCVNPRCGYCLHKQCVEQASNGTFTIDTCGICRSDLPYINGTARDSCKPLSVPTDTNAIKQTLTQNGVPNELAQSAINSMRDSNNNNNNNNNNIRSDNDEQSDSDINEMNNNNNNNNNNGLRNNVRNGNNSEQKEESSSHIASVVAPVMMPDNMADIDENKDANSNENDSDVNINSNGAVVNDSDATESDNDINNGNKNNAIKREGNGKKPVRRVASRRHARRVDNSDTESEIENINNNNNNNGDDSENESDNSRDRSRSRSRSRSRDRAVRGRRGRARGVARGGAKRGGRGRGRGRAVRAKGRGGSGRGRRLRKF